MKSSAQETQGSLTATPASVTPTNVAIDVRRLSKKYHLYAKPSDRLKQSLWHALPQFLQSQPRQFYWEFWALRDLSFTVEKGETVGIIGRNGSGKSTLLQIIAGTLVPSEGEVEVSGRVAALLELGSGFNPEFTGRENVYLNGSIWGLTQTEIEAIFDDVAAFADIGQFIDQPVKLYSSGMFVRLAFAVQAFVPKEIFVVDEVLAVGDEAFQRKCMTALDRFRDNGGTVLLVSHDAQTIIRQCGRCLLLHEGQAVVSGPSKPVTDWYQQLMYSPPQTAAKIVTHLRQSGLAYSATSSETIPANNNAAAAVPPSPNPADTATAWFDPDLPQPQETVYGTGAAEIVEYGMYTIQGDQVNVLVAGQSYQWRYTIQFYQQAWDVHFGMMLKTTDGLDVAGVASFHEKANLSYIPAHSRIEATFTLQLNVVPGKYFLNAGVGGRIGEEYTYLHRRVDIAMIQVIPPDTRDTYGIAYLSPKFSYRKICESKANSEHP